MEISYRRRHDETYMVIESAVKPNGHELKMLKANEINALMSFYTMNVEGKTQYWYEITGMTSLKDYVQQRGLSLDFVEKVITYLQMAYSQISGYLISQEHIVLNHETIYIEQKKGSFVLKLCYFPDAYEPPTKQFLDVLEYLVSVVDGKDRELAACVYELYDIASSTDYSFSTLINSINENRIGIKSREEYFTDLNKKTGIDFDEEKSVFDFAESQPDKSFVCEEKEGWLGRLFRKSPKEVMPQPIDLVEEEPMPEDGEAIGRLIYDGDREEENFLIDDDVFLVGRNYKSANGRINSESVSSLHARIMRAGKSYYIEDARSEHGTYVNGRLLRQGERYPLKSMDRLCFGDVNYVFM